LSAHCQKTWCGGSRKGLPASVAIIVPENWTNALVAGLTRLGSDARCVIHCRRKVSDSDQLSGIKAAGDGAPVVYIAANATHIPTSVRRVIVHSFSISSIDPEVIRAVLRRCTRGRVPQNFAPDLSGVRLPIVLASINSGARAQYAMAILKKLASSIEVPEEETLPALSECIEYGPLRQ
jgi:hypothetical protein